MNSSSQTFNPANGDVLLNFGGVLIGVKNLVTPSSSIQQITEAGSISDVTSLACITNTGDAYTVTMPDGAAYGTNRQLIVKDVTAGAALNPVTLVPAGSDLLDSSFNAGLSLAIDHNNAYTFQWDGVSAWQCVGATKF